MIFTDSDMVRFNSKVNKTSGCWNWTASCDTGGYGSFAVRRDESDMRNKNQFINKRAHRISFLLNHGRHPGPELLHSCDNVKCVRPDHLREGSHSENMAEARAHGRTHSIAAWQRAKTHCPQGHSYSGVNLYILPNRPHRYCRTCKNAAWMRMYYRRKDG